MSRKRGCRPEDWVLVEASKGPLAQRSKSTDSTTLFDRLELVNMAASPVLEEASCNSKRNALIELLATHRVFSQCASQTAEPFTTTFFRTLTWIVLAAKPGLN